MADNIGVMVLAEVSEGKLSPISTELLGAGRKLADDLGQELSAVLIGSGVGDFAKEAIAYGADKAYVTDDSALKDYQTDSYLLVMEKVVQQVNPQIILIGQTTIGRDLAPRLGFRLDTAATLDCIALEIDSDSKRLLQTKPVYGGNALGIYTYDSNPQIATVRAKAMTALEKDDSRSGEVVTIEAGLDSSAIRTSVLEQVKEGGEGIKLEDAPVVIAGGRGIGSAEGFQQLDELAKMLGGAVGASRPACDNGWIGDSAQIGLTGKIVSPDLYVAVGISGASQHMAGCTGSKTIVAFNKDAESNVFKMAHYGIAGDWKASFPAFVEKVKELTSG